MRRAALAIVSTVAALVILLSFKTHSAISVAAPTVAGSTATGATSAATAAPRAAASATPSASGSTGSSASSAASTSKAATTTTTSKTTTTTYTGAPADTRYGPVQVQVTVTSGKVTAVQAVEYPENDPRDQQINAYAIPKLNQEATSAGSAKIDSVSGATFTSDGYLQSLQSALDKAGL